MRRPRALLRKGLSRRPPAARRKPSGASFLLLKGIPEEDLDYYVFKIGKLVTDGTDFAAAAGQFLKQREKKTAAGLFRSAARLTGGAPRAATANETMNRLIRGV